MLLRKSLHNGWTVGYVPIYGQDAETEIGRIFFNQITLQPLSWELYDGSSGVSIASLMREEMLVNEQEIYIDIPQRYFVSGEGVKFQAVNATSIIAAKPEHRDTDYANESNVVVNSELV